MTQPKTFLVTWQCFPISDHVPFSWEYNSLCEVYPYSCVRQRIIFSREWHVVWNGKTLLRSRLLLVQVNQYGSLRKQTFFRSSSHRESNFRGEMRSERTSVFSGYQYGGCGITRSVSLVTSVSDKVIFRLIHFETTIPRHLDVVVPLICRHKTSINLKV